MTEEDPGYNIQTVEDEVMLGCLDFNGEGMSNDEISSGLWMVLSYFAKGIENQDARDGMAWLLENLANDLRIEAPRQHSPEVMRNLAVYRLNNQAEQEGRLP